METVDWRPRKLRFKQREKTLQRRVLVVAAVIQYGRRTGKKVYYVVFAFLGQKKYIPFLN